MDYESLKYGSKSQKQQQDVEIPHILPRGGNNAPPAKKSDESVFSEKKEANSGNKSEEKNTAKINGDAQVFRDTREVRHGTTSSPRKKRKNNPETAEIRGFPKSVLSLVKQEFNDGPNYAILAAFVIVHADTPIDLDTVPDNIRELVENYKGVNTGQMMVEKIDMVLKQMTIMNQLLTTMKSQTELADAYEIFDRLGFRQEIVSSPGKVNFTEHGVFDLLQSLRSQSEQLRRDESIREGRPIR